MEEKSRSPFPFPLLEDPTALAAFREWREEVYRDLLDCQRGRMTEGSFRDKYVELGEDIADGGGILLTKGVYDQVRHRTDCAFRHRSRDNMHFAYYEAVVCDPGR